MQEDNIGFSSTGQPQPAQVAPYVAPATCGLAIASLVLGILSFCIPCIPALIGLILGIVALVSISRSSGHLKGTGLAVAGIVLSAISFFIVPVLLGMLMPALAGVKDVAQAKVCEINMKGLSNAMMVYQNDYSGQYPTCSQWCDLLIDKADVSRTTLWCKAHGDYERSSCYAMNKYIEQPGAKPGDMVLLFETAPGWNQCGGPEMIQAAHRLRNTKGCNVLFVDGHVEFVEKERFGSLLWTQESSEP